MQKKYHLKSTDMVDVSGLLTPKDFCQHLKIGIMGITSTYLESEVNCDKFLFHNFLFVFVFLKNIQ